MPYENMFNPPSSTSYYSFVWSQVANMQTDEIIKVDIGIKSVADFRINLCNAARTKCKGGKFQTKTRNGKLFVKCLIPPQPQPQTQLKPVLPHHEQETDE